MINKKFKKIISSIYSKIILSIFLVIFVSPHTVLAANPLSNFGHSLWDVYNNYIVQPLSKGVSLFFIEYPVKSDPVFIVRTSPQPKKNNSETEKVNYISGANSVTYITNNYPTTTIYQNTSSGGGGGGNVDTSLFVEKSLYNGQILTIFDRIGKSISNLATTLKESITTSTLNITGNATIGGNLTITGNIIGNVVGTINPSFTLGSVPFQGATGLSQDNSNFFWDVTNHRLGIGTNTPTTALDVVGSGNINAINGLIQLGDFTEMSGATWFKIDDGSTTIRAKAASGIIFNNNLSIGKNAAPSVALDVVGDISSLTSSGTAGINTQTDITDIGDWQSNGNGTKVSVNNSSNRISLSSADVRVSSLSGTGTRAVVADASGILSTSGSIPTSLTQGSVVFAGSGGVLSQDNANVYFDDTANEFRIGSNTDLGTYSLQVTGGIRVDGTAANEVQFTGNNSFNPGFVFNGSSSNTHMYTFDSQNLSTSTGGQTVFTNSFLQLSGTSYIQPYQQNLRVIRTYPGTGTANTLEVDNTTENAVPGTYRIALFKLSGVDKAFIDQTGGAWFNGNVGVGTSGPNYKLEVIGTFRTSGNALFGTNTSSGTTTPENISLGGTYGSNTAGNVGNLKIDLYNDGTSNRSGFGISANKLEYQTPTSTVHAFYVGGNLIQSIDDNSVLIKSGLFSTSTYAQRIGNLLTQNYQSNNTTIVDNAYYNGTSWTRLATGYASGIQMYNGHLMMVAGATGTGTFTPTYPFKANSAGTVGIGGDGGNVANTFTGNTLVATSSGVGITTTVSTGTGSTAGVQILANSLTTGNGLEVSSSSVTTGNLVSLSSTSTSAASNTQTVLNVSTSGANPINQTTYGGYFSNTHTGTNSVNTAIYATASGGSSNYAANFGAALLMSATTPCISFQLGTCASSDNFINRNGTVVTVQGSGGTTLSVGGTAYLDAVTSKVRMFSAGSGEVQIDTNVDAGAYALQVVGNEYFAMSSNTALGFNANDGTNNYLVINTQTGTSAISRFTLSGTAPTIASAAGTQFINNTETPGTYNVTGTTNITGTGTSSNIGSLYNQLTINGNNTLTVSESSNLLINGAVKASSSSGTLTITNSYGLNILAGSALNGTNGVVTNGYGLSVNAPTGATNNYSAVFSGGNVGIKNTAPGFALHVGSSAITDATTLIRLEDANSTCDFNANAGGPTCGSDITLKKDITSLDTVDLLTKIAALNPVSYRWLTQGEMDPLQYGFIAQEVEAQFPDLVSEHKWIDGSNKKFLNMSGLVPYAIGAIKELNIKIQGFSSLDTSNTNSVGYLMKNFLADISNSVVDLYAKVIHSDKSVTKQLCVADDSGAETCITKAQLDNLLQNQITNGGNGGGGNPPINPPTDICPNIDGDQSALPEGMHLDESYNCVADNNTTPPTNDNTGNTNNGTPPSDSATPPPGDQPQP